MAGAVEQLQKEFPQKRGRKRCLRCGGSRERGEGLMIVLQGRQTGGAPGAQKTLVSESGTFCDTCGAEVFRECAKAIAS